MRKPSLAQERRAGAAPEFPTAFPFYPDPSARGKPFPLRHGLPHIPELAALLAGRKEVLFTAHDGSNWDYLMDLCRLLDLAHFVPQSVPGRTPAAGRTVFLGRSRRVLKEAAALWSRNAMDPEWGLYLGYPRCCVESYVSKDASWGGNGTKPVIPPIRAQTRGRPPFAFTLNNVFNFFSRLSSENPEYKLMADLNVAQHVDLSCLHVIPWHPCSYDCAESLRLGAVILKFLERHVPALPPLLRHYLRRPVLFLDSFEFAVLDGEVGPDAQLSYRRVMQPPHSLLAASLLDALKRGDRLSLSDGLLRVYKGSRQTARLEEPRALLLDFSRDLKDS